LKTISQNTPDTEHWQQLFLSQDINFDTKSWAGSFELLASYRNYHLSLQEDQDHTAFSASAGPMAQDSAQLRDESMNNFYGELLWRSPEDQPLTWIAGVDYFNEKFRFDRIFVGKTDFNLLSQPAFGPFFTYGNLYCSFLMAGNPSGSYDGGCEGTPGLAPGLPGAGPFGSFPYIFPSIGVQASAAAFGAPGSFINSESVATFASATYKFTDELSIRGDLRWDQTRKSLNYIQGAVGGFGQTALGASYLVPLFYQIFFPYHSSQSNTFDNLAPSVTLQYKASPTINLYATYATGFRAGSYNLGTSTPAFLPYKPEKNANYEIGAKTAWLDGRLNINGDVFYMTQSDLVEPQADPAEPSFIGLYYLANVGNARTWGAELSAVYLPIDWLGLGVSVGWLDDKFTKGFSNATSIVGQEIPLTRHWTINMTSDVDYPLTDDVNLIGNLNWRLEYGGWLPAFAPPTFALETVRYKSLNKLDLDAGVEFGQTRVVGFVDNAFDNVIPQFEYTATTVNVSEGLTYGVRIEQRF
jgi:iron complex outermembrane receptor protein